MPIDLDQYREQSRSNWDRISENWASEREWILSATRPVNERLVERLNPSPGETILDIASGTGDTGYLALERIGGNGQLISTDFSSGMVEAASAVSKTLGITNVEHRVLDAEQMDLADDSVDKVLCRWGYMLMADPAAALAETRRVLRPDGLLSFSVWTAPDQNEWASAPAMVLVERGHLPPPEPQAPSIFAMADPDRIQELVTGAGFDELEIEQVDLVWPYSDAGEHWQFTLKLAGPLADAISRLDEEERESIRGEVAERVEPLISGGGVSGRVHVVTAA